MAEPSAELIEQQKFNKLSKKWEPKEWHPFYEEIVIKSARGHTNKQLAAEYGVTPQHIMNITSTQQARKIRSELIANIRDIGMTQAERRMAVANDAFDKIERYFSDEEEYGKRKGAMVDRAMKMLQGVGELKPDNEGTKNVTVIGDKLGEKLIAALTKSDQVREKYVVRPERDGQGEVEVHTRASEVSGS